MSARTGRFVTLEGGEGAGKSTQIARLRRRLRQSGEIVVTTREPGGSPRAEFLRSVILDGTARPFGPFAEALLFASARADHLATTIRPALRRGDWVLCDRFTDSTRVYQGVLGAVPEPTIRALERVSASDATPHLTLILDVPAKLGLARAQHRRELAGESVDRFEGEDLAYHSRIRTAFLAIAAAEPERCRVIDASGAAESVETLIWQAVEPLRGASDAG